MEGTLKLLHSNRVYIGVIIFLAFRTLVSLFAGSELFLRSIQSSETNAHRLILDLTSYLARNEGADPGS